MNRDEVKIRDSLPVVIRAAAPRDLPGLVGMARGGLHLDLPTSLLGNYTPLKGLIRGRWLPSRLSRERVRSYVARVGGVPHAFVQVRGDAEPHKWHFLYLGTATRGPVAVGDRRIDLWSALLDYTSGAAGRRGVRRLYARLPGDAEAAPAFYAANYSRYSAQTVHLYQADRPGGTPYADSALAASPVTLRPQAPSDTWAVHQLYTWTAPKLVQYAEAYTSQHWALATRPWYRSAGAARQWGFLVEQGNDLAVYCRAYRDGKRTHLEFLFDPEDRALLAPTIDAVVRWLAPGRAERVYCTTYEFQAELQATLAARGFAPLGTQELLVRHTTVAVQAGRRRAWPTLEKVRPGVLVP